MHTHNSQPGIRLRCALMMALATTLLGACASFQPETLEQRVAKRSDAYWEARMKGDYKKAYEFTAPSYRIVKTVEQYRLEYGAIPMLRNGQVAGVTCEQERCIVKQNFTTSMPMRPQTQVPITRSETWVREDGQWWIYID